MALRIDCLQTRRIVHMCHRWDDGALLLQSIEPLSIDQCRWYLQALGIAYWCYQKHIWAFLPGFDVKVFVRMLGQHNGRKRTKAFTKLDLHVHDGLHLGVACVTENTSGTQGPRAKFHSALEPANDLSGVDRCRHVLAERCIIIDAFVRRVDGPEEGFDLVVCVFHPK